MSSKDTSSNTGQSTTPTQAAPSVTQTQAEANHEELQGIWSSPTETITQSRLDELTEGISGGDEWRKAFIVTDRVRKDRPEEMDAITFRLKEEERERAKQANRSAVRRASTSSKLGESASGSSALITTSLTEEPGEMSEERNE